VRVTIDQVMIDHGRKGDCSSCPVALGLLQAVGGRFGTVDVYPGLAVLRPAGGDRRDARVVTLPRTVSKFVEDFDAGRGVAPFAFKVTVPGAAGEGDHGADTE
jgi:hypothetical protein